MTTARTRRTAAVGSAIFALGLASGCSLLVSLDGLSTGTLGPDGGAGAPDGEPSAPDGNEPGDAGGAGDAGDAGDGASGPTRTWRQILNAVGPPGLHSARMTFDETRGKAVLFGGSKANRVLSEETWEWDGAAWSQAVLVSKPGVRLAPGLTFDSARHLTMLLGGSGATSEPREWDGGAAWVNSGVSAPAPASLVHGAGVAYDRARNLIVVFGGTDGTAANADTWEWSAATGYIKRSPAISPSARRAAAFVYDVARARSVLFGGLAAGILDDLWEWDGKSWTKRTPANSPPARRGACAAYDSARKVMVVFGGRGLVDSSGLSDTWEWDGTSWRSGPPGPPGRSTCAMTFDSARGKVVMFGGSPGRVGKNPSQVIDDTWVYE